MDQTELAPVGYSCSYGRFCSLHNPLIQYLTLVLFDIHSPIPLGEGLQRRNLRKFTQGIIPERREATGCDILLCILDTLGRITGGREGRRAFRGRSCKSWKVRSRFSGRTALPVKWLIGRAQFVVCISTHDMHGGVSHTSGRYALTQSTSQIKGTRDII
jgi:hypothetical protein